MKMQLNCPMPKFDFDIITLGHGSGGLLTNQLLESGVFDVLSNEFLDEKHDGAILNISGKIAFSTDSYVITPYKFPGGDIGELAVNGTVNDLAMCGATPKYLSLSFILEEGLPIKDFWEILMSIKQSAENADVKIVTGDTKVVEKGKGDKIFINTSGIGIVHPNAKISSKNIEQGDKIILSGNIASHGIAIMSIREGLTFDTTIESDTRPLHLATKALLDSFGAEIHLFRDATRGGVASVLNEIAHDTKLGIQINQTDIPVKEEVAGACEMLGLDPLYVANEGVFVAILAPHIAPKALEILQQFPAFQDASIIGDVVEQHAKQVVLQSAIGGKRVINMLVGEQLPRIC